MVEYLAADHAPSDETPLLEVEGRIQASREGYYLVHDFDVPPGMENLRAVLSYHKDDLCQVFLSLFAPDGYRGTRMRPAEYGEVRLELHLGLDAASPGGIPGPVTPGRWRVLLDVERSVEAPAYTLRVHAATAAPAPGPPGLDARASATGVAGAEGTRSVRKGGGPGWYRGELHSHSIHSDGKTAVEEVVDAACREGLDFIALTDHFTSAGWQTLDGLTSNANSDGASSPLLLRGLELTGHRGHANIHGLREWVDPFVDGPASDNAGRLVEVNPDSGSGGDGWDINAVARKVREKGGLFCVNHPFAGDLGWRYTELDWNLADLMEVYHHQEGPHNALQLAFWDEHLRRGRRIVGVAGTDSHHPRQGRHRLGQCFTCVYADGSGEAEVLAGLRSGRVYASLGPELEFRAERDGADGGVQMGGEVPADGGPLLLRVELSGVGYPAQLYVLKDGFHFDQVEVGASGADLVFKDREPSAGGYYRLELYAAEPQERYDRHRRPEKLLLVSNPVFVV